MREDASQSLISKKDEISANNTNRMFWLRSIIQSLTSVQSSLTADR